MKKATKNIIQAICQVQLAALASLKEKPEEVDYLHFSVLGIEDLEVNILQVIEDRIEKWDQIHSNPSLILTLDEYQLGICMHILYAQESTWLELFTNNPAEGVNATWKIFDTMYKRFHPEVINFLKF